MNNLRINIDGLDLFACCCVIVGGFTGNWLPLLLVLIAVSLGVLSKSNQ